MTLPLVTGTNNPNRQVSVTAWNSLINEVNNLEEMAGVNVLGLGADNTGATDCAEAFNSAIASNTLIVVPAGTYKLDTVVSKASLSNFAIVFMPGVTLVKSALCDNKLFFFNDCHRFRITSQGGLAKIDDSAAPNSGSGEANDAIYLADCDDVEIDHIWFYSGTGYAVAGGDSHIFGSGRRIHVHHNRFSAAKDVGVYLSGPGTATVYSDAWVHHNHFENCLGACGSKRRMRGVWFTDNTVENCHVGFFEGEADTSNLPGEYNIVERNRFTGIADTAVSMRISAHGSVKDNWFINCTGPYLIVIQGVTYTLIKDNHCLAVSGEYTSASPQRAVYLGPRTFDSVTYNSTDNLIETNEVDGIFRGFEEADTSQTRNTYRNNVLTGVTTQYTLRGPKSYYTDATVRKHQGVASGYSGSERVETQLGYQSTNGSNLNVWTLSVAEGTSVQVSWDVVGNITGGGSFNTRQIATFRRAAAGSVTLVGTVTTSHTANDTGGTPVVTFAADTAAQAIRGRIQGLAGITINWVGNITYTVVATNA